MNAHQITITPTAAALFNTATTIARRQANGWCTGLTTNQQTSLDRMYNRALDSAARTLRVHRDDIMAVYNLHRGLPIARGKDIVRPA